MNKDHLAVLQNMPVFGGLEEETLEYLLSDSITANIPRGKYLFRENDRGDSMFIIESGRVAVIKSWEHQDYILAYLTRGDCVGEMELIDITSRSASVLAVEDTTVIKLARKAIFTLFTKNLEQFTTIQMNMGREVSRRLRETDQKLFQEHVRNQRFKTLAAEFKVKRPPSI